MTESPGNEPGSALFDRVRRMVDERGVDIDLLQSGNTLRLEFADGQRILINFDARMSKVWLASRSGGLEFIHQNGTWCTHERVDFFARLAELMEQAIASNEVNMRPSNRVTEQTVQAATPANPGRNHSWRIALAALAVIALGVWGIQELRLPRHLSGAQPPVTLSLNKVHYPCTGNLPANGSVTFFPESGLHAGNQDDPAVTVRNDHLLPVLLILALQHTVDPAMSILVHARQSATVHLPAGRYDMMFSVGNTWCNPRSGFSEGQLLKFDKSLAAQPGKPMQVSIRPSGTGSQNFRVLVRKIRKEPDAAPAYTRDGSMELKRRANGHFYLPGTIGGISATFVVDPGAPVTSISSDLANQAGVTNCKEVQSRNDATGGCVAFLPRMMLDKFVVRNITVAVIPNLEANVLGSDVLRNFTVSRHDDTMLIGKHKSRTRHDRK